MGKRERTHWWAPGCEMQLDVAAVEPLHTPYGDTGATARRSVGVSDCGGQLGSGSKKRTSVSACASVHGHELARVAS